MEEVKNRLDILEKQLISCENVFDSEIDNLKNNDKKVNEEKSGFDIKRLKTDNMNLMKKIDQMEKQNNSIEKNLDEIYSLYDNIV